MVRKERETDIDVSVNDFVRVCFGDENAIYGCGCVGHGEGFVLERFKERYWCKTISQ